MICVNESEEEDQSSLERESSVGWTSKYRLPIAIVSAIVAVISITGISSHGAYVLIGWIGIAAVVIWVFVFARLYRKGY